jgi:hypothetical protein
VKGPRISKVSLGRENTRLRRAYTVEARAGADTEGVWTLGIPVSRHHPKPVPYCPIHMVVDWKHLAIQNFLLPMELQIVGMLEIWPGKHLVQRLEGGLESIGGDGLGCKQGDKTEHLARN